MSELDRLADLVAARVRERLAGATSASADGHCAKSCNECGHCAVKLVDDVRALRQGGMARIAALPGTGGEVAADIAQMIDHTLLKPDASAAELQQLCEEARRYGFASVCVNSANVARCRALLGNSSVMVCAVVGFPLGAMAPNAKAYEAREAVRAGAAEIDMVLNIAALKDGDYALVLDDISKVVAASRPAKVKVILETGMLDDPQKIAACTLSKLGGAAFVKTSTGFGKGGATAEDIALMRRVVGDALGVKASGGVRSQQDALKMIEAGATRIGASASVAIVTGKRSTASY